MAVRNSLPLASYTQTFIQQPQMPLQQQLSGGGLGGWLASTVSPFISAVFGCGQQQQQLPPRYVLSPGCEFVLQENGSSAAPILFKAPEELQLYQQRRRDELVVAHREKNSAVEANANAKYEALVKAGIPDSEARETVAPSFNAYCASVLDQQEKEKRDMLAEQQLQRQHFEAWYYEHQPQQQQPAAATASWSGGVGCGYAGGQQQEHFKAVQVEAGRTTCVEYQKTTTVLFGGNAPLPTATNAAATTNAVGVTVEVLPPQTRARTPPPSSSGGVIIEQLPAPKVEEQRQRGARSFPASPSRDVDEVVALWVKSYPFRDEILQRGRGFEQATRDLKSFWEPYLAREAFSVSRRPRRGSAWDVPVERRHLLASSIVERLACRSSLRGPSAPIGWCSAPALSTQTDGWWCSVLRRLNFRDKMAAASTCTYLRSLLWRVSSDGDRCETGFPAYSRDQLFSLDKRAPYLRASFLREGPPELRIPDSIALACPFLLQRALALSAADAAFKRRWDAAAAEAKCILGPDGDDSAAARERLRELAIDLREMVEDPVRGFCVAAFWRRYLLCLHRVLADLASGGDGSPDPKAPAPRDEGRASPREMASLVAACAAGSCEGAAMVESKALALYSASHPKIRASSVARFGPRCCAHHDAGAEAALSLANACLRRADGLDAQDRSGCVPVAVGLRSGDSNNNDWRRRRDAGLDSSRVARVLAEKNVVGVSQKRRSPLADEEDDALWSRGPAVKRQRTASASPHSATRPL